MRRFARVLRWLLDLAVIALTIACILHVSRRRNVTCSWDHMRAACTVEVEDSLGRVASETIHGIRGAAYRSGKVVGLVTDAQNKGEHALFGTYEIQLDTEHDAARLDAFAEDHEPDQITLPSGVSHPRFVTALMLAALFVYAIASRMAMSALARRTR